MSTANLLCTISVETEPVVPVPGSLVAALVVSPEEPVDTGELFILFFIYMDYFCGNRLFQLSRLSLN